MTCDFERAFWGLGDIASCKKGQTNMELLVKATLGETQMLSDYLAKRIFIEELYAKALEEMDAFSFSDHSPNTSLKHAIATLKESTIVTAKAHRQFSQSLNDIILQKLSKFNTAATSLLTSSLSSLQATLDILEKDYQNLATTKSAYLDSSQQTMLTSNMDVMDIEVGGFPESLLTQTMIAADKVLKKAEVSKLFSSNSTYGINQEDLIDHFSHVLSLSEEKAKSLIDTLVEQQLIHRHIKRTLSSTFRTGKSAQPQPTILTFNKNSPIPLQSISSPGFILRKASWAKHDYDSCITTVEQHRLNYEREMSHHCSILEQLSQIAMEKLKGSFFEINTFYDLLKPAVDRARDVITVAAESMQPETDRIILLDMFRVGGRHLPTILKEDVMTLEMDRETRVVTFKDQVFGVNLEEHTNYTRMSVPLVITQSIKCIDALLNGLSESQLFPTFIKAWTVKPNFQELHYLRSFLNTPYRPLDSKVGQNSIPDKTVEYIDKFDVELWTNLIKLYLSELPDSIIPSSAYHQIKKVCGGQSGFDAETPLGDESQGIINRTLQLRSIIAEFPPCNYHTLKAIIHHLSHYYEKARWLHSNSGSKNGSPSQESADQGATIVYSEHALSSPQLPEIACISEGFSPPLTSQPQYPHLTFRDHLIKLCSNLGPIFLRPPSETSISFHDRHPSLLLQTLISEYSVVFGDSEVNWNEPAAVTPSTKIASISLPEDAPLEVTTEAVSPVPPVEEVTELPSQPVVTTSEFQNHDTQAFEALFIGEDSDVEAEHSDESPTDADSKRDGNG